MFPVTSSFRAAVAAADRAASQRDRLAELLARVMAALATPAGGRAFSDAEEEALQRSFGLDAAQLAALLEGAALAFRRAAAQGAGAQALADQVVAAGGSDEAAAAFRDAWRTHSAPLLAALRAADWGSGDALRSVAWRVVVPMAGEGCDPDAPPQQRAVFELGLGRPAGSAGAAGAAAAAQPEAEAATKRVVFELTHDELGGLFDNLERIQAQLDALS